MHTEVFQASCRALRKMALSTLTRSSEANFDVEVITLIDGPHIEWRRAFEVKCNLHHCAERLHAAIQAELVKIGDVRVLENGDLIFEFSEAEVSMKAELIVVKEGEQTRIPEDVKLCDYGFVHDERNGILAMLDEKMASESDELEEEEDEELDEEE